MSPSASDLNSGGLRPDSLPRELGPQSRGFGISRALIDAIHSGFTVHKRRNSRCVKPEPAATPAWSGITLGLAWSWPQATIRVVLEVYPPLLRSYVWLPSPTVQLLKH